MSLLQLNNENFTSQISSGVTLVDFFAPWCGPCKAVAPIVAEIATELRGRVAVGKLDTDQSQEIAVKYGIMSIPTVIIFKDGVEQERLVGSKKKDVYLSSLNKY